MDGPLRPVESSIINFWGWLVRCAEERIQDGRRVPVELVEKQ